MTEDCLFCEKKFANNDDVYHHILLDHNGIASSLLEQATLARSTKTQLGNYIDKDKEGVGIECPGCFEIFPDIDKINEHTKKAHNKELDPKFAETMKKTITKTVATCEKCKKNFLGVVFTRIDDKIQNVCFNCYEDYFGTNALLRLTIGTPDDVLEKMRTPL